MIGADFTPHGTAGLQRIRHAELLQHPDRLVVHLAELHAPDRENGLVDCKGCDSGCSCAPASWPCRTWSLLAEEVDR